MTRYNRSVGEASSLLDIQPSTLSGVIVKWGVIKAPAGVLCRWPNAFVPIVYLYVLSGLSGSEEGRLVW